MTGPIPRAVEFKDGALRLIDQKVLPTELKILTINTLEGVYAAIKDMTVRGAPAIGVAGAYGMVIAARASTAKEREPLVADLTKAKAYLDSSRPTAVNLMWATGRMLEVATGNASLSAEQIRRALAMEADALAAEDIAVNRRIGEAGAAVIPQNANLLHHCNTGFLATVDHGTALGIIYSCVEQKKNIHVWVDETRPRLQGARLTAWELMQRRVPMHLIADNAAGLLMRTGKVDAVVFGADRVTANGDVANKVGTYKLAVVARENGIPVYAAVPTSTIDLNMAHGDLIPIEERSADEVTHVNGSAVAPEGVPVFNPAFDVTPHKYLTGIVTEAGICYPPFGVSLRRAVEAVRAEVGATRDERLKTILSAVQH
eukprot:tig00021687_g23112.t1